MLVVERLAPPRNVTSTAVHLHDRVGNLLHCPFCGKISAEYAKGEFIPNVCDHMLVFYADLEHQYVSKALLAALRNCQFPVSEEEQTCTLGDSMHASWPITELAGIVPYSISFIQVFDLL